MKHLGLLGHHLRHSKSQEVYESLLLREINYTLWDLSRIPTKEEVLLFLQDKDGMSVTSPYKASLHNFIEYDYFANMAESINSVKLREGVLLGTSTDYPALLSILDEIVAAREIGRVAVLGGGVMGKMVERIFTAKGISQKLFRYGEIVLCPIDLSEFDLVINATKREYRFQGTLKKTALFYDLNYGMTGHQIPSEVDYLDGIELLKRQAELALHFFRK